MEGESKGRLIFPLFSHQFLISYISLIFSQVERIQERALRAVFKSKSETYNDLLTKAGLPSLYQQRLQNTATFMYKVKNRLVLTYITEIFNTKPIQYNLRNADFNIPRFRTVRYGKHSLRYFGPHLWNKLDKTDREKPNLKIPSQYQE